jgi:hypothetical protein
MRWGQRFDEDEEVPDELRGKSPREVAKALKDAKDAQKKADDAETARAAAAAERDTQKTEIEKMRARMTELEANQKPVEQQQQQEEEAPSPWIDPEKFVDSRMTGLTAVALSSGMMTAEIYFKQNLNPRDVKIYNKYKDEVVKGVNTFSPQQRVMPQSWMNMFIYVKGLHDQEIQKAESSSTDFFSEPGSRGASHEDEPEEKLSAEEEEVCRKFHYDPKTYLERKKTAALSQSSKGAYARYPVPTTTTSS